MLRGPRERIIQTLCYEAGGLILSVPLYAILVGGTTGQSAKLMLALSVAVILWAPLHNTVFDLADWRLAGRSIGRSASDRPTGLRMVHAFSMETTAVVVTLPILMWIGGHSVLSALRTDLVLTLLYAGYAFVFHRIYDWARPVRRTPSGKFAS